MMKKNVRSSHLKNHVANRGLVRPLILLVLGLFLIGWVDAGLATDRRLTLKSPDGKTVVTVQAGGHLRYDIAFHGTQVVLNSALGIVVDGKDLGAGTVFAGKPATREINEQYPVMGVHATAINHCFATVIPVTSGTNQWQLEFRVFNDGVACRYQVPGQGVRHINGEATEWNVPVGSALWSLSAANTSYEALFEADIVGQLPQGLQLMAPALLKFPGQAGYGMMTEANLINYSDLSLKMEDNTFKAFFHNSQQGWEATGDIVSPWRVTVLAANLNDLVNSDIIKNLCPPPLPELAQAAWIRPGRSIWHWLTGGEPKLAEQHRWIDGTKELGYEYYLIDDGWRKWNGGGTNAWNALAEVVAYAQSRQVDIWAWVDSKYVFTPQDRREYFQNAKRIGVVGLKIDFPQPANPEWVNWYEEVLRDAAAQQLMVDFHGAVKPTGRERTWPNEMTREAIAGREQGKNPSLHDTTLPFVRYVQGHADYTPTLLIPERLKGSSFAHELAMAVVFTSPFLCMGDNPRHYLDSEAGDVLKALPPVWDETRVLPPSEIGQLAAFARRHGHQWFIGVINNTTPRREKLDLNFLGRGNFKLVELADSPERNDAWVRKIATVTSHDTLTLPLRKDGGYVAWIVPE
jgi:alpha-glucosidase